NTTRAAALLSAAVLIAGGVKVAGQRQDDQKKDDAFRFKSGVELINVTATVTDKSGRFVPGLRQEDFTIYEDNARQDITDVSNERKSTRLNSSHLGISYAVFCLKKKK